MRRFLPSFIVLLFFSILALRSLVQNSFYTSHDGFTHTARIAAYFQALSDGQFPPRWAPNFNNGLGSPIFTYIYPVPYFLGSATHFVGFSFQDSFRLVMVLSTFLSSAFMYFWLKRNFGSTPALVGAIFYVWVPYRFLNLYVRAAYAENLAYMFLPVILLSLQDKKWKMFVFSLALLLLTHNVVAAMFLPTIIGWGILQKSSLKKMVLGMVAAFSLAAFIYLPDFFERGYVLFDSGINYFSDHFVAFWQFFRSPWCYGFDFAGTTSDAMSFQLGLTQIGVFVMAIYLAAKKKSLPAIFFTSLTVLVTAIMTETPWSVGLWKTVPVMKNIIDFPWRFIGVTTLTFSFLAAFVVSQVRYKKVVAVVCILAVLVFNRNHLRVNETASFPDKDFINYTGASTATSGEFTPRWHNDRDFFIPEKKVEVLRGNTDISNIIYNSFGVSFLATGSEAAKIRINRLYFPQTDIFLNGSQLEKDKQYRITGRTSFEKLDDSGLIQVDFLPPGGKYQLKFSETPLRKIGNVISLGSLVLLLFL